MFSSDTRDTILGESDNTNTKDYSNFESGLMYDDGTPYVYDYSNLTDVDEQLGIGVTFGLGGALGRIGSMGKMLGMFKGSGETIKSSKSNSDIPDLSSTLNRIEKGEKFPHRNDGSIFRNDIRQDGTRLLPKKPDGYYNEYVHPTNGSTGPKRIITGKNGETYYSPDHYRTKINLK